MINYIIMSYNPMNYTPVSGNYPLPYTVPSSLQNQQGTTPAKRHKCQFCVFTSDKPYNVRRHIGRKHPEMNNTNVQSYALPMEIENAGVVYQQNYQQQQPQAPPSYPQLPLHPNLYHQLQSLLYLHHPHHLLILNLCHQPQSLLYLHHPHQLLNTNLCHPLHSLFYLHHPHQLLNTNL